MRERERGREREGVRDGGPQRKEERRENWGKTNPVNEVKRRKAYQSGIYLSIH